MGVSFATFQRWLLAASSGITVGRGSNFSNVQLTQLQYTVDSEHELIRALDYQGGGFGH